MRRQPSYPFKPALLNLSLATGSFLFCVVVWLLVEVALRWLGAPYPLAFEDMAYLHVYSDIYGWVPRRGFHIKNARWPETTINQAGYRGRLHTPGAHPGKVRVLMLGDSLAFGYGVSDAETSSSQLERVVPGVEVINLGVEGYGTDQELLRFEREGLGFHPDVVVVNFCLANDFRDNAAQRAIYQSPYPKPYFVLADGRLILHQEHLKMSAVSRAHLFIEEESLLFNGVRAWLFGTSHRLHGVSPGNHPPAVDLTIALLQRLAQVARAHHMRMILAVYPDYREFLRPTNRTRAILDAPDLDDVVLADLRPLLEGRGVNQGTIGEYALDNYFHANARGNRVIAEILAELLRRAGIRPTT